MARQLAFAGEAVLEQQAADAGIGHQLVQAVAQIAPGDALLTLAQASGRATIICGGDDAGEPLTEKREGRKHSPHAVATTDGNDPIEVIDVFLPHMGVLSLVSVDRYVSK
ncbi:hypothetical protein AERO8C_20571 [Aeromonas veronii]|uniref:Uncharacterized protein n=1 Tax=Aeromonas veronii TaxID=654 RepID=A0A653L3S5_AERVE|nr:hypothetical protein AERO8C_20571 [Aeromonas veronii]